MPTKNKYKISVMLLACGLPLLSTAQKRPENMKSIQTSASMKNAVMSDGEIYKKADSLIALMTVEEKVKMIHASSSFTSGGIPRLGIPELTTSDGPHGVRLEHGRGWTELGNVPDSGTYLPVGICLGATWNPKLGYEFGSVLGSEAAYRGKDVILGPGINIMRTPLNGRNFEYVSEDPYLVSKMVVGYIKGVQDQGISACVKHFLANNQEHKRFTINVEMSERALREIYLPGFDAAIHEGGVNTIMASYNKFRGQWVAQNNYLLNQILKKEWGFKGIAMSDWAAVHSTMQSYWNGMDLEMGTDLDMLPNPDYGKFYLGDTLTSLIKANKASAYYLDDKVKRILYVMYKTHMMDGQRKKGEYNTKGHQQVAEKVAEEGIVLLKNDNDLLPLSSKVKTVAVIGQNANRKQSMGGGSSQVKAYYEITPLEGMKKLMGDKVKFTYSQGYNIARGATADQAMIQQAVDAASKADVAVIVCGWTHGFNYHEWKDNAYDAEDVDKPNMDMPFGQNELIKAVLKANPKTVVVLMGGGPIDMTQWVDQTPAIMQAWYPGMEGGTALARLIAGKANPSGKLPVSFPKKLEDAPSHKLGQYPGDSVNVYYSDDIYVGYRYYDTYNQAPQFEFGRGLSYTTFEYNNLTVTAQSDKRVKVTFNLKNTGKMAGAEVAQVYVKEEKSLLPRPEKELKSFSKVFLNPGEQQTVTLYLDQRSFSYFNDVENEWVTDHSAFDIMVGGSSRSIKLNTKISL
jgi:beta-glucosidase